MGKRRITKPTRELLAEVSQITPDFSLEFGRRHPRIVFRGPHGTRSVTICATPSDIRARKNSIRDSRKAAEEVGLI